GSCYPARAHACSLRPDVERVGLEDLTLDRIGKTESAEVVEVLLDVGNAGPGPVRAEESLCRDLLEAGKIFEESLGRDAADVEINVAVAADEEKRGVHPQGAAAVGEQDFELGKIHGNIVNVDGIAEFVARTGKNRSAGVKHHRNAVGFGGTVDDFQLLHAFQIIVGKE